MEAVMRLARPTFVAVAATLLFGACAVGAGAEASSRVQASSKIEHARDATKTDAAVARPLSAEAAESRAFLPIFAPPVAEPTPRVVEPVRFSGNGNGQRRPAPPCVVCAKYLVVGVGF
jgi:hypothetical protein